LGRAFIEIDLAPTGAIQVERPTDVGTPNFGLGNVISRALPVMGPM
jgi:hypothetical protein